MGPRCGALVAPWPGRCTGPLEELAPRAGSPDGPPHPPPTHTRPPLCRSAAPARGRSQPPPRLGPWKDSELFCRHSGCPVTRAKLDPKLVLICCCCALWPGPTAVLHIGIARLARLLASSLGCSVVSHNCTNSSTKYTQWGVAPLLQS